MKPLTLEKTFNIAFFEKDSFHKFLSFKPSDHVTKGFFDGREVYEPNEKLKEYLRFINEFIVSYLNVNKEVVFSYRKGSSTYDAVAVHSCSKIFFNADIKSFFPSINRKFAKRILLENTNTIPIIDIKDYIDVLLDYIIYNDSLPVGFITSPSFSNACLFEFDNALQNYCNKFGFVYSRYSDDIIVSSVGGGKFNDLEEVISLFLSELGNVRFQLNKEKTKIARKGNKIKLLGMVILPSGRISVDIKIKQRVEHLIHFYLTDRDKFIDAVVNDPKIRTKIRIKKLVTVEQKLEAGIETISGLLNHINTIDKEYLNKLKKKYGNAIVDMFFHKSVN
ncbi:reverse transcriptase family protein [Dickeya fangzhongdai]|uniref:reverse transcriptase family protein n=1 Tax=Dickeya fangzhongdai TaxID=1778540 RepID=UPI00330700FD